MHLSDDNMQFSTKTQLLKITKILSNKMVQRKRISKLFFAYIANYLMLKRSTFSFSKESIENIEDLITNHLATFCLGKNTDFEYILYTLIVCYEIFVSSNLQIPNQTFSIKFLKFIRNLDFLYKKRTWKRFFDTLYSQTVDKNSLLCFNNKSIAKSGSSLKSPPKYLISSKQDIMLFLMHISFYLLQQPHDTILTNFVYINEEKCKFPVSEIMHLSQFMERKISEVYMTQTNHQISLQKDKKLKKNKNQLIPVIGMSMSYIPLTDFKLLQKLLVLNKKSHNLLVKYFYKKILNEKPFIKKSYRLKIYQKLIILNAEFFYDSIRLSQHQSPDLDSVPNHFQTIKKDVDRTKFFKGDPKILETLLQELSEFVPSLGYYQGLNCIAAFMLDYTKNFLMTYDILSFMMHKQMKKYFLGDFQFLNKLIFVGEMLIKEFYPDIHQKLGMAEIGHDFYMSSIIVTVYFNILQFSNAHSFIIESLDLFFSQGWIGFYKVNLHFIQS